MLNIIDDKRKKWFILMFSFMKFYNICYEEEIYKGYRERKGIGYINIYRKSGYTGRMFLRFLGRRIFNFRIEFYTSLNY